MNLQKRAWKIRHTLLDMFGSGKAHHFGGSLSCAEAVACLYFYKMKYSKELMKSPDRDRFIMSKGHSVPTQYVALALLGIIPREELKTIKQFGSRLQGHPDIRKTPGIEANTGSLGQGLSVANGMAMAARLDELEFKIYVLAGDGEMQEGQMWEAVMTSSHYKLGNVCLIVDRNHYQSQGLVNESMRIDPLEERLTSFGWRTITVDGHDTKQLCRALDMIEDNRNVPLAVIADTVKGKGVSFIENTFKGHNYAMTETELQQAFTEVETILNGMED